MKKLKIAVTGGIGSGKSKALQILSEKGYPTFSCDEIYKSIINTKEYVMLVEKHFPTCVTSGKIDKTKLAQVIFEDPQKRSTLNEIAHPLILKSLFDQMLNANSQITFAEVPLLFEEGLEGRFDGVIVIKREISERIKAIQLRDNISKEAAEKRIFSQFDYYTKDAIQRFQKCNAIVIENNDNILILEKQVDNALNSIMQRQM